MAFCTVGLTRFYLRIGFLGDDDNACGTGNGSLNDYAIGLGVQSCQDSNGCTLGGSGHIAGQQAGVKPGGALIFGPWYVFGR